jgi:hypothetical protein
MPKVKTPIDREIEDENEGSEQQGGHLSTVDQIIEHFIDEATRRETIPIQWVYKYDNDKSGDDRQGVGKFKGEELKDQHEIGLLFGGGRYGIQLYNAKGKGNSIERKFLTFRLGPVYDKYKAEADAKAHQTALERIGGPGTLPASIPAPGQSSSESFLMVKEILAMLLPIIGQANRAAQITAPAPRQESPAEMINSYAMMQKLLKTNLFDTAETLKQFSRRYTGEASAADFDETDPEPEEKEKTVVEKIIEMIEPFFSLIASKSPAASIAAQGLRAAPQFVEILNDPSLCRMIVQHFDRTKGRAAADLALHNIGINRAALFQQIPQQAGQGGAAPRQSQPTPPPTIQRPANGKKSAIKPREAATAAKS